MDILDIHVHPVGRELVVDPRNLRLMEKEGACLTALSGVVQLLKERMAAGGIRKACLMGPNPYDGVALTNEAVRAIVAADPDRFIGFVGVHPCRDGAAQTREEIVRAVQEWGFRGVGEIGGSDLLSPEWAVVFETCQELQVPVLIHLGIPLPSMSMRYCHPFLLDDLANRYQGLSFIAAHVGVPWVLETIAIAVRRPNVAIDVSALPAFNKAAVGPILSLCQQHGLEDQVLFGSDFPLVDPGAYARQLNRVQAPFLLRWFFKLPSLSAGFRKKLLCDNARRLLRLPE